LFEASNTRLFLAVVKVVNIFSTRETLKKQKKTILLVFHGKKGFVIPTKSFVKKGITKIFCYHNKMFGSINKTFGCCGRIFGCSNKNYICCP